MDDDMDWLLIKDSTPSDATGPDVDHTLGTDQGTYCYIEASDPALPGHKGHLVSPKLPPATNACLELYLFMYGVDMGSFNVYQKGTAMANIFSISGDQGYQWKKILLEISISSEFEIVLEGVVSFYFDNSKVITNRYYTFVLINLKGWQRLFK